MTYRYRQLVNAIKEKEPMHILEVGTSSGYRAVDMLAFAPTGATYYGFDLFEDMTEKQDEEEFNIKRHHSMSAVDKYIGTCFPHVLIKGNTRDTLPRFARTHSGIIDFIFIDGGHSVETITSDFKACQDIIRSGGTIILDDYYTPEQEGRGCNSVIANTAHDVLYVIDQIYEKRPDGVGTRKTNFKVQMVRIDV